MGWAGYAPNHEGGGGAKHRLWVLNTALRRHRSERLGIREVGDVFVVGIKLRKHHLCFYGQGLGGNCTNNNY